MTAIRIDDAQDPRIAGYRNIRDRDLARRDGLFVAEGKVVLRVLLEGARFEPVSVLVLESRMAGLDEVLTGAPEDLPVYVAPQAIMDQIAGFHIHRGVLALARRREPAQFPQLLAELPSNALVLALVGISNHDNIGSIFRSAAAFGADAVLLDPTCCDPLYRKAVRVSVGGALKVPYAVAPGWKDMVRALDAAGFRQLALTPVGQADIGQLGPDGRTVLYLGTEGDGLPDDLIARMEAVRIPIASDFDSLNVAAAAAIALHRLSDVNR